MKILAIDPGPQESALVEWDGHNILMAKIFNNWNLRAFLHYHDDLANRYLVQEKIVSLGMPVGQSVFETAYWIGIFAEAFMANCNTSDPVTQCVRLPRMAVKMNLCQNSRAKDSNIRQALIDRFGPPRTKKEPGLTYGLKKDLWAAFGLAVTFWDDRFGMLLRK